MKLRLTPIVLAVAVTVAASCSTDAALDPSNRPDPPPPAAFDPDFSFFEGRTPDPHGGTSAAWQQALQTVAMARTGMEVLELPRQLLAAAVSGEGTRDGNAWRWPYSTVDGPEYDGELRSTVVGNQYDWNLFVTAPGHSPPLNEYVIAQGRTVSGGYEGIWWLADVEAGTDTIVAAVSWLRNLENTINFSFSDSDTVGWRYERSAEGNVLTHYRYDQPRRRVSWYPDGSGRSWTSTTSNACWNADLHDIAC